MKPDPKTTSNNSQNRNFKKILEGILKNSNNIYYEHDLEGYFSFISPQIKEILGYSPEERKIRWQEMLTDNPANKSAMELTKKAIETGERQNPYEIELFTKDGKTKWLEIRESPVIEDGKTIAIIGASVDITDRKEKEKKLIEREENFRLLVENMSELIVKFDLEGCILYVSPNYLKIFDVTTQDIIGKKFMPEVHPDDGLKIQEKLKKALREPFDISHMERMKTRDGWRWFSWRNRGIKNTDGVVEEIISVGRDITDTQNTNEELNKLALVAKETDNAVIIADAKRNIEWTNEGFTRLTGYELHEVIGKNPLMLLQGKETDLNIIQRIIDAADKKIKIDEELILYKKNGEKYWAGISIQPIFTPDGKIEKLFSIHTDITERKKIEKALVESENNYRLLVENQKDLIAKFDLNGCLTYVSPNYCSTFNVKYNDIFGQRYIPKAHPDDEHEFNKILDKSIVEPFDINYEVRMMTIKGWRWFEWSNRAIRIHNLPVSEIVTVGRDITDRKVAEEELRISEETSNALLNSYIDSALLLDAHYKVVALNECTANHYHKSKEELIGVNIFELMTTEIAEERKKRLLEAAETRNPVRFEDKREGIWFDNIVCPIFDKENKIFRYAVYAIDITERKYADIALMESEKKYQILTEISPVGIFRTEPNGYTTYVNPRWCEISGMKAEEALGDGWLGSVFPEDVNTIKSAWRDATKEGSKSTKEYRFIQPDGSVRWVLGNAIPELNDKGEILGYVGTITDITDIKSAEEALKLSEEKFSKSFYLSPDSFTLTSVKDGTLIEVNQGFEDIFGYSKEEVIGKSTIELQLWRNVEDRDNILKLITEMGRVKNYVAEYNRKDGRTGIAEVSMELINISNENLLLTIVRDITEKKKNEQEIKESEEKFSAAFYSSMDAYAISNLSTGAIVDVNDVFCKMFEAERSEILGKNTIELGIYKNTSDREKVFELLKENEFISNIEAEYYTLKKKPGWAQFSINKINILDGLYLFISIRDITDQKETQKEIEEYQKNLKVLSSELTLAEEKERRRIAVYLHDHLGQSLAMSKIKLAEALREDDEPKILKKIESAKTYLDDSISNSRIITYELSPPVLHELGFGAAMKWRFDQILDEHGIHAEVKDNATKTILKDDVRILLFRSSMEIVNNTIKHASAKKIIAEISDDDNFFYVSISDDGIGFDPTTAEKEATKKKSFGLFSIRERILFLNGELKINSEIDKGTNITIKIPTA